MLHITKIVQDHNKIKYLLLWYNKKMSIKYLTTYHPNGQKKAEGSWDGYEPVGDHISWHENGNKENETIELNESIQIETSWHENGQIKFKGALTDYIETGLWTYWHEGGHKKAEGYWIDKDEREGKWNFWNSSGQIICSGIHRGWQGNGLWTFWDDHGNKIHERDYRNSELLGVWKNLRAEGCSDDLIESYKEHIFNVK